MAILKSICLWGVLIYCFVITLIVLSAVLVNRRVRLNGREFEDCE